MREHDTDSRDCWCKPDLFTICPECDGSDEGCWYCGKPYNGLVLTDDPDENETLIIAHNDPGVAY
jgi:hypothetical protein